MKYDIEDLLKPISEGSVSGEDMLFSAEEDAIKDARRSDDPNLNQGEWKQELKKADWRKAEQIAAEVIAAKSKHLRFAGWLVEALARQYHFQGAEFGLLFLKRLLEIYWYTLHPRIETHPDNGRHDLSARIAPLEWLNKNLSFVLYSLPSRKAACAGLGCIFENS